MIKVEQRKDQNDITYLSPQEVRETSQFRRIKTHVPRLIDNIDKKNALTPALRELVEASFTLQTISTKVLAAHLHRSPATIRAEFLRILSILGDHDGSSALGTNRDTSLIFSQVSDK